MKAQEPFVWYATDPIDGELILHVDPQDVYKRGHIYCIRMVAERLPKSGWGRVWRLEAQLGPCGLAPARYWQEGGVEVLVPFELRTRVMLYAPEGAPDVPRDLDRKLVAWILFEWARLRNRTCTRTAPENGPTGGCAD